VVLIEILLVIYVIEQVLIFLILIITITTLI
jgi:hypothetical protein